MITLYREPVSSEAEAIQEKLRECVVAHRVVIIDGDSQTAPPRPLPTLRDGEEWISGQAELELYLERLRRRMEAWNRYQSDACYIGDDGEIC